MEAKDKSKLAELVMANPLLTAKEKLQLIDNSKNAKANTIAYCLLCAKPFMVPVYSGAFEQLCPECKKTYRDCAVLVCKNCNAVIARIAPTKTDSGYVIKKGQVLHADKCNICSPGLTTSTVLEIKEWEDHIREKKLWLPLKS